jgi:hypothetical protein
MYRQSGVLSAAMSIGVQVNAAPIHAAHLLSVAVAPQEGHILFFLKEIKLLCLRSAVLVTTP